MPGDRILDVGAGEGAALERFNSTNEIVAVDIAEFESQWLRRANVTTRVADATALPFADGEFDVVFSNSVIEHVPRDRQAAFAAEVRRVGERYFVQTPNRYFPIEPHYQLPFFQFVPERARRALTDRVEIGWMARGGWAEINLLDRQELQALFPDALVASERLAGLTKSLMAIRGPEPLARE